MFQVPLAPLLAQVPRHSYALSVGTLQGEWSRYIYLCLVSSLWCLSIASCHNPVCVWPFLLPPDRKSGLSIPCC